MKKPKVVAVVGPTASGKTGLAIDIAKQFTGEVISADSRQVYRRLDIGTAKVTEEEMIGVPHHLIDICDISDIYTAADFKRDAAAAIVDITNRKHLPIIAGGTFFYVDSLLERVSSPEVPPDPALREELAQKSTSELLIELQDKDPERAATIDPNNPRRLIRALEIWHVLGHVPKHVPSDCPYEVLMVGIETDRDTLRARYRLRAETWLQIGFQAEVENLLKQGISRSRMQEIGFEYTLMLELIDQTITTGEFTQKFVEKNWQYAKRQLTWLKRDNTIQWFSLENRSAIFERIRSFLG